MSSIATPAFPIERPTISAWLPLLTLPLATAAVVQDAPPWIVMWSVTLSIFLAMKLTVLASSLLAADVPSKRTLSFLFLWPGMDVDAFFGPRDRARRPKPMEWAYAFMKTTFGLVLMYVIAPALMMRSRLIAAWVGMIGIGFTLLFGAFDLLSLVWRQLGVDARRIMRCPIRATSLSDYWGLRWNLAFRDFAHRSVFRPFRSKVGSVGAMAAVFVFSGLIDDGVISGSTRTGWGQPTLFFVVQALGILVERCRIARLVGLGRGLIGWAYCWMVIGISALLTFTRAFMERVVLPTLETVGAV